MKRKEIIDSLSHMLYVKFSNHNPGFALVQLPCSQMVSASLQEHAAFLGSCSFFAEPIFQLLKTFNKPPTSTSFSSVRLSPFLSCKAIAMGNTRSKYFSAASTFDVEVLSLFFSLPQSYIAVAVWQLRVQLSS